MNKTELIAKVAEATGLSKEKAGDALKATLDAVTAELVAGGKVTLIGFGTFEVRERAARVGHNPQDPTKTIKIAASKSPAFKAGKALKDAVNPRVEVEEEEIIAPKKKAKAKAKAKKK